MFTCCLTEQERINKHIEDEIRKEKRKMRKTQKIILLGVGESGKSTFLKQMQIIHGNGFNENARLDYRTLIYENVLRAMSGLINGKNELKLQFSRPNTVEAFKNFRMLYIQLMEEREKEEKKWCKKIHIDSRNFSKCEILINQIWNDETIQEAYARRREFPRFYVENIVYYIQNLNRISQINYLPTSDDILRCRRATTCIIEVELNVNNVPFLFVDVGGQRTQRQKWQHCLSDATAILFLVSSNEYDEYLREDFTTSRLDESCKVFETLINYRHLQGTSFILFLNKYDLLIEKIKICNILNYCRDFRGNPYLLDDVKNYLIRRFSSLKRNFNDFNRKPTNDSIIINQRRSQRYLQSYNDGEIYPHFTTAVDTNNIRVIFDMVKDMIFERNRQVIMLS